MEPGQTNSCPFCGKNFKVLGSHLRHCPQREGQDYQAYLSQKTGGEKQGGPKKKPCAQCGKFFQRLDTHLRTSATCRAAPQGSPPASPIASVHQSLLPQNFPTPLTSEPLPHHPIPSATLDPFLYPKSQEEWQAADGCLAATVVPAVLAASTVDEKHHALCSGAYRYFSAEYGTRSSKPSRKRKHKESHRGSTAELRLERNKARQQLRKARRSSSDQQEIRELAKRFHHSLRQFSRARKAERKSLQECDQLKARKECATRFWKFAAQTLDDTQEDIQPAFDEDSAEEYFVSAYSSEPRVYHRPLWLPTAPSPDVPFVLEDISAGEIQQAIMRTKQHSSPSPYDQIPYVVFKQCPSLTTALADLFSLCWKQGRVPSGWKYGAVWLIPKAAAREDPDTPSNFRPIALTSCVGKLFTTILKNRWLSFMVSNGYLDTSVQKAFLPGVPGCLEQYTKLSAAISEAYKNHRSLTVCWLDLANAYGSVHHSLIDYALKHYHAPPCFCRVVSHLYTDLKATFTCASWTTKPIPLRVGVYQGDPLSVVVFNTVMAILADTLKADSSLGYTFSRSSRSMHVLQYADDTCLIADGPASCQRMLERVESWLQWTGMRTKVPKCHSLAIKASSGKRYDPRLQLCGTDIPFIGDNTISFLGGPLMYHSQPATTGNGLWRS